jgi:hypothetical protein
MACDVTYISIPVLFAYLNSLVRNPVLPRSSSYSIAST